MVVSVTPLPIGNALRIQVAPPRGATLWRLKRNTTDFFTDQDDPAQPLIAESNVRVLVDSAGLVNGTPYFYRAFYWNGSAWSSDIASVQGVPSAAYFDASTDALSLVRDRLDVGAQNEVAAGTLIVAEGASAVKVLTAPPIFEDTQFPVIVVHLDSESPAEHGIGELIDSDELGSDGQWYEHEGWLAKTVINVTGWALNPDTRIALRKSLRRLVLGNLAVFNAAGLREIDFSQTDQEELTGSYGAPMYFTVGTFSCLSPLLVGGKLRPVRDVTSEMFITPVSFNADVSLGSH